MDYIHALEISLGKKAKINFLPLQLGDVPDTYASIDEISIKLKYRPSTSVTDELIILLNGIKIITSYE